MSKEFNDLRVKFHLSIGYVGANHRDEYPLSDFIDEGDWNKLTESEKDVCLSKMASEWSENYIDLGAWVE